MQIAWIARNWTQPTGAGASRGRPLGQLHSRGDPATDLLGASRPVLGEDLEDAAGRLRVAGGVGPDRGDRERAVAVAIGPATHRVRGGVATRPTMTRAVIVWPVCCSRETPCAAVSAVRTRWPCWRSVAATSAPPTRSPLISSTVDGMGEEPSLGTLGTCGGLARTKGVGTVARGGRQGRCREPLPAWVRVGTLPPSASGSDQPHVRPDRVRPVAVRHVPVAAERDAARERRGPPEVARGNRRGPDPAACCCAAPGG